MTDDLCLELRSDPRLLVCVRSMARSWFEACGCSGDMVDEMVLAVDEACSNAIRHAYGGDCDQTVRLTLRASADTLEIRLCDEGVPCPSEGFEPRPLETPDPDELRPGGLGVQLMHRAFDEVLFCPGQESGNCVILRKRRGGA